MTNNEEQIILIKNYFYYERECFKEKESYFCCKDCKSLCGTAIGAMICEAERSESTPDFIHKLKIAEKEANETLYWLELLKETQYITQTEYNSINNNMIELLKMLVSSIKTARANYKQQQNSSFVIRNYSRFFPKLGLIFAALNLKTD